MVKYWQKLGPVGTQVIREGGALRVLETDFQIIISEWLNWCAYLILLFDFSNFLLFIICVKSLSWLVSLTILNFLHVWSILHTLTRPWNGCCRNVSLPPLSHHKWPCKWYPSFPHSQPVHSYVSQMFSRTHTVFRIAYTKRPPWSSLTDSNCSLLSSTDIQK